MGRRRAAINTDQWFSFPHFLNEFVQNSPNQQTMINHHEEQQTTGSINFDDN